AKPLVVHCYAGISRSTAGAYVAACALNPRRDELAIARQLRRASATATPNSRFVALADRMLCREGRMVAAIDAIGPGTMATGAARSRLEWGYPSSRRSKGDPRSRPPGPCGLPQRKKRAWPAAESHSVN